MSDVLRGAGDHRVWLPLAILLLALSTLLAFGGDRGHFYRPWVHDWISVQDLALADSLFATPFRFFRMGRAEDGGPTYHNLYNRRPIGVFALINLAIRPFEGDMSAQIFAARMLMLGLFAAAALLAYFALVRIIGDRWVASGATLLAFSSCYALGYADAISSECSAVLFAWMLVFHGMVRFADAETTPKRRFLQLLLKVCAALLLAWQVYGLLLSFLLLGVAAATRAAWRRAPMSLAGRGKSVAGRGARALATGLASNRYALLAGAALLFGGAVLGYNIAAEYSAYGGERSISELPSVRSALRRTGLGHPPVGAAPAPLLTADFYRWQFHRVGVMSLPYAVPALPAIWINHPTDPAWAQPRLASVGVAVVAVCLWGLVCLVRRRRALFATLVLGGFCWAVPMRFETAVLDHDFEALCYIGVPLFFFTLLLLGARGLARRGPRLVVGAALGAAIVFALSSKAMADLGWDADAQERQQALFAEFEAIRERTRGSDVLVAVAPEAILYLVLVRRKFWYYMAGSVLQRQDDKRAHGRARFVLSLERVESEFLLTPSHRYVFLYDSPRAVEEIAAARRREYQRIAAGAPVVRSEWNVYWLQGGAGGGELAFLKTPCAAGDMGGRFLVHVVPVDVQDLPPARRRARFDNLDFEFRARGGVLFDGKCMARIPLPRYAVAALRLGRAGAGGEEAWWPRFDTGLRAAALRGAVRWARARQPTAQGGFDVYLDGKTLTYIREPCARDQAEASFFLHVTPLNRRDLPRTRRRAGFDNLDFRWADAGAWLDGRCVARARLPDYDIADVRTGQYDETASALWMVEFPAAPAGKP